MDGLPCVAQDRVDEKEFEWMRKSSKSEDGGVDVVWSGARVREVRIYGPVLFGH